MQQRVAEQVCRHLGDAQSFRETPMQDRRQFARDEQRAFEPIPFALPPNDRDIDLFELNGFRCQCMNKIQIDLRMGGPERLQSWCEPEARKERSQNDLYGSASAKSRNLINRCTDLLERPLQLLMKIFTFSGQSDYICPRMNNLVSR